MPEFKATSEKIVCIDGSRYIMRESENDSGNEDYQIIVNDDKICI